jgi:hypothetical protein
VILMFFCVFHFDHFFFRRRRLANRPCLTTKTTLPTNGGGGGLDDDDDSDHTDSDSLHTGGGKNPIRRPAPGQPEPRGGGMIRGAMISSPQLGKRPTAGGGGGGRGGGGGKRPSSPKSANESASDWDASMDGDAMFNQSLDLDDDDDDDAASSAKKKGRGGKPAAA